eukprot:Pgem_evm1s8532
MENCKYSKIIFKDDLLRRSILKWSWKKEEILKVGDCAWVVKLRDDFVYNTKLTLTSFSDFDIACAK